MRESESECEGVKGECEAHQVLCLPRNLHFEVQQVLRLPRNLHIEGHRVPATKSAN